jgi:galactokinase
MPAKNSALEFIPVKINDVYSEDNLDFQTKRYNDIVSNFKTHFGISPSFIVRAPGRVNLIGEHLDYSNFGVLPMALDVFDIVIAVSVRNDRVIELRNADKKYQSQTFSLPIEVGSHSWTNYFKAGVKGVLDKFQIPGNGMNCFIDGTVPYGAGVSSSAAFVCASALAALVSNGLDLGKKELAEIAIVSERIVGVNTGGMDQSASIMSKKDFLLLIEFYPSLEVLPISLMNGSGFKFIMANSNVISEKAVTAPMRYNLRVFETKMATILLNKLIFEDKGGNPKDLRDVLEKCVENSIIEGKNIQNPHERLIKALEGMISLIIEKFPQKPYSWNDLALALGLGVDEVKKRFIPQKFTITGDTFYIFNRTKHVYTEALRVFQFKNVCLSNDPNTPQLLGDLMNQSHASCRDLFDCSCPELNKLTGLSLKYGALGSRLTGNRL